MGRDGELELQLKKKIKHHPKVPKWQTTKEREAHVHEAVHCDERRQPINQVWPNIKMWHHGLTEKLFSCDRRNQTVCQRRSKQAGAPLLPWSGTAEVIEFHPVFSNIQSHCLSQFPPKKFLGKMKLFFHGKNVSLKPDLLFHQERSKIYLVHALSTNMQTFVWEQAATSYSSLPRRTRLAHRCTSCSMPSSAVCIYGSG